MNDSVTAPTIGQALAWAFQRLREEWRALSMLAAAMLAVSLIGQLLMYDDYAASFEQFAEMSRMIQSGEVTPEQLEKYQNTNTANFSSPLLLLSTLFSTFVFLGIIVLLSRLADMDRSHLFDGGIGALAGRALWVLWRFVCAIGWMILIMLAFMIIFMVTGFIFAGLLEAIGGESFLGVIIGIFIMYAAMLVVMTPVFGSLAVSIYAASRDIPIGILATWKRLQGVRWRFVLTHLSLSLIFIVIALPIVIVLVMSLFSGMSIESYNAPVFVLFSVVLTILNTVAYFLWLTVGAAFAPYALHGRTQETGGTD